jgi:hypothetical protein
MWNIVIIVCVGILLFSALAVFGRGTRRPIGL